MKTIKAKWIFLASLLAGTGWVSGNTAYGQQGEATVQATPLTDNIAVTEQVRPQALPSLKRKGYATIIDMRPDGEAAGQPASSEVGAVARENGLRFHYIPVPNGGPIPAGAVTSLQQALADSPGPVLMYCRSGSRAARTWSLVEASRPQGMDAESILAAVKKARLSADDLRPAIEQRISNRAPAEAKPR